jgi:hypothetical protein
MAPGGDKGGCRAARSYLSALIVGVIDDFGFTLLPTKNIPHARFVSVARDGPHDSCDSCMISC